MSSLLDKYRKYYRGSDENKMKELPDGSFRYNHMKKELKYDDLSNSINTIQKILQKEIVDYSKAYIKVNDTLEPNDDPFTKKLRKAKEFKNKVGEGLSKGVSKVGEGASKVGKYVSEKSAKVGKFVSEKSAKVGKFVSEKSAKVKEQFYGKKPNQENYGFEMSNISSSKSNENKKNN
jgi:hypothetical protein